MRDSKYMITLENMTRDEKSLMLYLETCAVDNVGRIKDAHLNEEDESILYRWDVAGLIQIGRVCSKDVSRVSYRWVMLSSTLWDLAHQERRARAKRLWENRSYQTAHEHRENTQTPFWEE